MKQWLSPGKLIGVFVSPERLNVPAIAVLCVAITLNAILYPAYPVAAGLVWAGCSIPLLSLLLWRGQGELGASLTYGLILLVICVVSGIIFGLLFGLHAFVAALS